MRFEHLKKHLTDMSEDELNDWYEEMSEARRLDGLTKLESSTRKSRSSGGTKKTRDKKITLTSEQFQILKAIGLV